MVNIKHNLILFLLLFLCLIMISAVSASDSTDDMLNSSQDMEIVDDTVDIVQSNTSNSFDDLYQKIEETPENQTLTIDRDYQYVNEDNHGIEISKSITIDGAGHTLDAKKSSRIFNITADNVILKNLRFINGNALGFYYNYYGGGAIYWSGINGYLENCTFLGNSAISLEVDPYAQEQIVHYGDDGTSWVEFNERPTGASTNQGGAITWLGSNGTISDCIFKNNHVDYPNSGGAIYWAGENGKIVNSEFTDNNAYSGSAVYWRGANGVIYSSYFLNAGTCDGGIYWAGENGTVKNSILLSKSKICVISPYSKKINANLNFWGDTVDDPVKINKISGVTHWILINLKSSDEFVFKGDEFFVSYDLTKLVTSFNKTYRYEGIYNKTGFVKFIADKTGFVNATFKNNKINADILDNNFTDDFLELAQKIRDTPEGGVLVLDKDYSYIAGSNNGILISKAITIDGAGHTLDAKLLSRVFNITADNVVIKNINFVNGSAFGRYFTTYVGGGAIYWSGNNGYLENCNFTNNHETGIEDDPFVGEEDIYDENGFIICLVNMRPAGARTCEGGAIVWNGTNGTLNKCVFKYNTVAYPNAGGAIYWRGNDGKILNSEFYDNGAFFASSIYWKGLNGLIFSSKFLHTSLFRTEIVWSGENGTISNSILISNYSDIVDNYHSDFKADYNFWGDTSNDINKYQKPEGVTHWFVLKSDKNISDIYVIDDSFILVSNISSKIDSPVKIASSNLVKYYKSSTKFKVYLYGEDGKTLKGKYVTFIINKDKFKVKTNKKGYATFNLDKKPGKYTIVTQYGKVKVYNKITIKSTLITKNVVKKVKKSAKFKIKVLNSKGRAFKKQNVKVKFKGKTYKLKTNKKGVATFKIPKKLKVGKYNIKTTYNKLTNSNKIIVKK